MERTFFQIKPIKLTSRAEIPSDVLPVRGLTARQIEQMNRRPAEIEVPTERPKNETLEEKKARKAAVKHARRVSENYKR